MKRRPWFLLLSFFARHALRYAAAACALLATFSAGAAEDISFNRDIRPILSDYCFHCHGPDSEKRKGGLRLDLEAEAKSPSDGRLPIRSGSPDQSTLIERILSQDPEEQMPPPKFGRRPSAEQVGKLREWIRRGAVWQPHWAFTPPVSPDIPRVSRADWVRNPIDAFVLQKLDREGITPSGDAPGEQLLRRLSLDLTGLPPSPEEVDAFLAEERETAYAKAVDRLLNSPHFGEHMAVRWLNAARYADTNGYQSDGERSMWRWRDWVIDRFNKNTPFDRMTIEQIAGDLLPGATRDQRIATGFNRNHRGNAEGGIVPEEYAAEYVADRVDTTSTVWLGLTMSCARCHDHKYDPVTQRDFYSLFALFNNVPESGRAVKIGNSPPFVSAPTPEQESAEKQLRVRIQEIEHQIAAAEPEIQYDQQRWELEREKIPEAWLPLDEKDVHLPLWRGADEKRGGMIGNPSAASIGGRAAMQFDGASFLEVPGAGDFGFFDRFSISAWINPSASEGTIFSKMTETDDPAEESRQSEGYSVRLEGGRVLVAFTKRWLDDALRVRTYARVPEGIWSHVTVAYDGSRVANGVRIYMNGEIQKQETLLDLLNQTFKNANPFRIATGGGPSSRFRGGIRDVIVQNETIDAAGALLVSCAESARDIAAIPKTDRSAAQDAVLRSCFLRTGARSEIRDIFRRLNVLRRELRDLMDSYPTVMVMEEMSRPRETRVLLRGEYDRPGAIVQAGVPAFLPQLPSHTRADRLTFARWLTSNENPLTRRVVVNQFWQMIFGTGIVATPEDFGAQGDPPSHPELLDWLACDFENSGWDVKRLLRTMVRSNTYRQASQGSRELLVKDPSNRLLARSAGSRLPAEVVRDQALAASGLLVRRIGGPSVKPYQPPGLWQELSGAEYVQDHGEPLWRRSLYTFWKRTSTPPVLSIFDAPGREACAVRSSRTNTPLQALAVMNETAYVEAARRVAERAFCEAAESREATLARIFRLVLARSPEPVELGVLVANYEHQRARFAGNRESARRFLAVGEAPRITSLEDSELAAFTAVANLVLNLDETLTRP